MVLHERVQPIARIIMEQANGTEGAVEFGFGAIRVVYIANAIHYALQFVLGRTELGLVEQFQGMHQVGVAVLEVRRPLGHSAKHESEQSGEQHGQAPTGG
jgi:hypothetical protein